MAEIGSFNCDHSRAGFDEVESRFVVIARVAKMTGEGAIGQMTRRAEADRTSIVEAAKAADHSKCLGEKACQVAFQDSEEVTEPRI